MPSPSLRTEYQRGDICIDQFSPYSVTHLGKLITPEFSREGPRNHCVAATKLGQTNPFIVRFTPLNIGKSPIGTRSGSCVVNFHAGISGEKVIADAEQAAELHNKHLRYLGKVGLNPWYSSIDAGTWGTDKDEVDGVYIRQDLLPAGTITLDYDNTPEAPKTRAYINKCRSKYLAWAQDEPKSVVLYDIHRLDQYSRLPDGQIVLHDVEPLYG